MEEVINNLYAELMSSYSAEGKSILMTKVQFKALVVGLNTEAGNFETYLFQNAPAAVKNYMQSNPAAFREIIGKIFLIRAEIL